MERRHNLLETRVNLMPSHEERQTTVYNMSLNFVDLFGRKRQHSTTIEVAKSINPSLRISFTAMSSVDLKFGVIEEVTESDVRVVFVDRQSLRIPLRGITMKVADVACVIEHLGTGQQEKMFYVVLGYPLDIPLDALCLQSVNADILDESGKTIHRLSADPLLMGKCHDSPVAA